MLQNWPINVFQITLSPLAKQSPFDREKSSLHYLSVEARDDLGKGNRNNVELVIHVKVRYHYVLNISTSIWGLRTPNIDQNMLFHVL